MITNTKIIDDFDFIRDRLRDIKKEESVGITLPEQSTPEQKVPVGNYSSYYATPFTSPNCY